MGLFEQFPYSNYQQLNLDWLIKSTKNNETEIDKNKTDIDNINKEIEDIKMHAVEGVHDSPYVNIMDFVENIDGDITEVFNTLYSKGYRYFYFPAGTYHIKFEQCVDFNIKGDGTDKTIIKAIPNIYKCAMYVDSPQGHINMEGFTLTSPDETTAKDMHGFRVLATGAFEKCTFKNIKFTGLATGFYCEGRAIWNSFYDCDFYGNYSDGLKVDGVSINAPFNNNNFYSCRFSNNRNYGIYMAADGKYACLNTVFYGCDIELNGSVFYAWGGSDVEHSLCFKSIDSVFFIGCYFEHNAQSERNVSVWFTSESEVYINNCTFVIEHKPFFHGNSSYVYLSDSYGIGNKSTLTLLESYADLNIKTDCYQQLGLEDADRNIGIQASSGLNFTRTNTIRLVGDIPYNTIKPNTITEPVYIMTDNTPATLSANLMEDGNPFHLTAHSAYSFYLINGKLRRIQ